MLSTHARAVALTIIVFTFCFLPVGAAMACEVCPPDDCHEEAVRHSAPQLAVQRAPALPADPSAIGAADVPPPMLPIALDAGRTGRVGLLETLLRL